MAFTDNGRNGDVTQFNELGKFLLRLKKDKNINLNFFLFTIIFFITYI